MDRLGRVWWAPILVAVLGTALAVWSPGPVVATNDEPLWASRAAVTRTALHTGDVRKIISFNRTSPEGPATQPGVTTMVLGALGEDLVRQLDSHEAAMGPHERFAPRSTKVLRAGQVLVALVCGTTLGVLTWLLSLSLGRRPAMLAGALLATEPYLLGHMGVLHTDAMVTLFGTSSLAALAAVLIGLERPSRRRSTTLIGVAAVTGALALLTKLLALVVLASGAAVVVTVAVVAALVDRRRRGVAPGRELVRVLTVAVAWAAATVALAVAGHPRMWVEPGDTWRVVWGGRSIASRPVDVFYRGAVDRGVDSSFLWVTTSFRMSPWLLVAGALAVGASAWWMVRPLARSPRRSLLALWLAWPVLYLVLVGTQAKLYDRYALPVWVAVAVLVGLAADVVARSRWLVDRRAMRRAIVGVALVVAAAVAAVYAPHRTAYVNPLVGGQRRAERTIPIGWGEGVEMLGRTIAEREPPEVCPNLPVGAKVHSIGVLPCGKTVFWPPRHQRYYVIRTVSQRQRPDPEDPWRIDPDDGAELVETISIDGVAYAQLWLVHPPGAAVGSRGPWARPVRFRP